MMMALMALLSGYAGYIVLAVISVRLLYYLFHNDGLPINWPLLGMHPAILVNFHRVQDKITEFLERSRGTFFYRSVWFTNKDYLMTSDPENLRYILSKDNTVYVKGPDWMKQFDIFGGALFNSDGDVWKRHRKAFHAYLNHPNFHRLVAKLIPNRIEEALVKVLNHVSERQMVVDLQDLFVRHSFDMSFMMATGNHARLLTVEFPENPFNDAVNDAWEAGFHRQVFPESLWKLQSWLQVGIEKKRTKAWKALDDLTAEYIATQRERCSKAKEDNINNESVESFEDFNFLRCYLTGSEVTGPTPSDQNVIKDNLVNFLFAATDTNSTTLSWFFYLLSKHPSVLAKLREELRSNLSFKQVGNLQLPASMNVEQNKLVYLHAALSETLRLFPPVPLEFRTCTQQDTLPTGHCIKKNMGVVISMYAMGRMTWLWGEDCHEFKPERWITEEGKIKREPPSKFPAFFAGPRICLGKDLGFMVMKATASTIIHNYDVQVLQGQNVSAKNSVFFQMKNGLKVRVTNRSSP